MKMEMDQIWKKLQQIRAFGNVTKRQLVNFSGLSEEEVEVFLMKNPDAVIVKNGGYTLNPEFHLNIPETEKPMESKIDTAPEKIKSPAKEVFVNTDTRTIITYLQKNGPATLKQLHKTKEFNFSKTQLKEILSDLDMFSSEQSEKSGNLCTEYHLKDDVVLTNIDKELKTVIDVLRSKMHGPFSNNELPLSYIIRVLKTIDLSLKGLIEPAVKNGLLGVEYRTQDDKNGKRTYEVVFVKDLCGKPVNSLDEFDSAVNEYKYKDISTEEIASVKNLQKEEDNKTEYVPLCLFGKEITSDILQKLSSKKLRLIQNISQYTESIDLKSLAKSLSFTEAGTRVAIGRLEKELSEIAPSLELALVSNIKGIQSNIKSVQDKSKDADYKEKSIQSYEMPKRLRNIHIAAYLTAQNIEVSSKKAVSTLTEVYESMGLLPKDAKKRAKIAIDSMESSDYAREIAQRGDAGLIEWILETKKPLSKQIQQEPDKAFETEIPLQIGLEGIILTQDVLADSEIKKAATAALFAKEEYHKSVATLCKTYRERMEREQH